MSSPEIELQQATRWMTLIALFILVFMGPFGSLCNIFIFTSKKLRNSSCALYFLCTAIFEFATLCLGIPTRLAAEHFGITAIDRDRILCKIRSYLITGMGTVAAYFILLACIDRCMATSIYARCRAFSQMKIAYRVAAAIIIIGMTVNIHALIYFDVQSTCIPQPAIYALFYSTYLIICTGILPTILILIFSIWTVKNIKHTRTGIVLHPVANTTQQRHARKINSQLVIMMLAQAFSSIVIDLTRVSCYSYYFLTTNIPKSNYGKIIAGFIFQFSNVLLYMNYSKSFYMYTLTSSLYRKIFYTTIQNCYRKLLRIVRTGYEQRLHSSNVEEQITRTGFQLAPRKNISSDKI